MGIETRRTGNTTYLQLDYGKKMMYIYSKDEKEPIFDGHFGRYAVWSRYGSQRTEERETIQWQRPV